MRDTPPRSVAAALKRLDANADPAILAHHADRIHTAMRDLIIAQRTHGFDIGVSDGEAYARPGSSPAGPARELRDLRLICRRAIAGKITPQQWTTAWTAMPERIRQLWEPSLIETPLAGRRDGDWERKDGHQRTIDASTLAPGFTAEGFVMLAPKPDVVLSIIERELAKITATPGPLARTVNAEVAAATAAITAAYQEITQHIGGRVIRNGRLAGRRVALGCDIDAIWTASGSADGFGIQRAISRRAYSQKK